MAVGNTRRVLEQLLEREIDALQGQIAPEVFERVRREIESGMQDARKEHARSLAKIENSSMTDPTKGVALASAESLLGAHIQIQLELVRSYTAESRTIAS